MAFVLDASVAIAWFVGKQATAYTNRLRLKAKREPLHVPALWRLEVVNAIWALQRRGQIPERAADTAVDLLSSLVLTEHPDERSMRETLALARRHRLSSYDVTYLALASDLGLPLACKNGPLRCPLLASSLPDFSPAKFIVIGAWRDARSLLQKRKLDEVPSFVNDWCARRNLNHDLSFAGVSDPFIRCACSREGRGSPPFGGARNATS